MTQHLHLAIGPVQSFVSQSRRTRDLWGSSYLLSFLAAHAMSGARQAGGTIIRPHLQNDPMLQWVERTRIGNPSRFGSLPNQFTVELSPGDEASTVAMKAERHFRDAWRTVCGVVWEEFVAHAVAVGHGTSTIWERQIEGFWEIVWVAGAPDDHTVFAQRKQWRTHWLPEEPGDKCMVMPDLQELSGYVRATDRVSQDAFWQKIRRGPLGEFDLDENERLSPIACVKRFFPRVAQRTLGWALDVRRWPSTVDVAAVPWCRPVIAAALPQAKAFAVAVSTARDRTSTGGVSSLIESVPSDAAGFAQLDANWFHRSYIRRELRDHERGSEWLIQSLETLTAGSSDAEPLGGPPIYFALLLADGDRLGTIVRSLGSEMVSAALAAFTREAPDIVRAHAGVTIYAGGDDVLALLPLDAALSCARDIERAYRGTFARALPGGSHELDVTLSTAVVFAHARAALSLVLVEAHRLLDVVAKDGNGRNSIAAGVYRRSGIAIQWVTTWERVSTDGTRQDAVECVLAAARALEAGNLSGSLLQDVRRTLGLLCGASAAVPGRFAPLLPEVDTVAFLRADIEHRLERRDETTDTAEIERLALLLDTLLRRSTYVRSSNAVEIASPFVGIDGLSLASFLANGGREEEHLS